MMNSGIFLDLVHNASCILMPHFGNSLRFGLFYLVLVQYALGDISIMKKICYASYVLDHNDSLVCDDLVLVHMTHFAIS